MELVYQVFDHSLNMLSYLFHTMINRWDIFGLFLISMALLRKIGRTFNKLKS